MGVDACIFAKKAKRYFWFGRFHNIESFWNLPDSSEILRLDSIKQELREQDNNLTKDQILDFMKANKRGWLLDPIEDMHYHACFIDYVVDFIEAYPDDQFFVATDCDGYVDDLIDEFDGKTGSNWKGEYMEWKPKSAKWKA